MSAEYFAIITHEGDATLAEFPDCPGCQTFVRGKKSITTAARDAVTGWLEAMLIGGREAPPTPSTRAALHKKFGTHAELLAVSVDVVLATRVALRRARMLAGLSQAELAAKVGVSSQAISQLESPTSNVTIKTLAKVADALGSRLSIELVPKVA